jgi:hypothetical protein
MEFINWFSGLFEQLRMTKDKEAPKSTKRKEAKYRKKASWETRTT